MKGHGKQAKPTGRTARYLSNPKNSYGPDGGRVWLKELKPDGAGEYTSPVFGESNGPEWTGDAAAKDSENGTAHVVDGITKGSLL